MTYVLQPKSPGTYWYHGHYHSQYPDGLYGAIIVHDSREPNWYSTYGINYELPTITEQNSMILQVADYFYADARDLSNILLAPGSFGADPIQDAIMVNNLFTNQFVLRNIKKKYIYYKFTFINVAAFSTYTISIDGVPLTIVEIDGIPVKPFNVDKAKVFVSQRVSFLVSFEKFNKKFYDKLNYNNHFDRPYSYDPGTNYQQTDDDFIFNQDDDGIPYDQSFTIDNVDSLWIRVRLDPSMYPGYNEEEPNGNLYGDSTGLPLNFEWRGLIMFEEANRLLKENESENEISIKNLQNFNINDEDSIIIKENEDDLLDDNINYQFVEAVGNIISKENHQNLYMHHQAKYYHNQNHRDMRDPLIQVGGIEKTASKPGKLNFTTYKEFYHVKFKKEALLMKKKRFLQSNIFNIPSFSVSPYNIGGVVLPNYNENKYLYINAPKQKELNFMNAEPIFQPQVPAATHNISVVSNFFLIDDELVRAFINDETFPHTTHEYIPSPPVKPDLFKYLSTTGGKYMKPTIINSKTNQIGGSSTVPFVLPYNSVVDILIDGQCCGAHPFHLHGHHFWVIDSSETHNSNNDDDYYFRRLESDNEKKNYNNSSKICIDRKPYINNYNFDNELININKNFGGNIPREFHEEMSPRRMTVVHNKYPVIRDVVNVPFGGWVRIRIIANNPGVWLFHCHLHWHMELGLNALFIEAPEILQSKIK